MMMVRPIHVLWLTFSVLCLGSCSVLKPLSTNANPAETSLGLSVSAARYEQLRRQMLAEDSLRSFDASVRLTAAEEAVNQKLLRLRNGLLRHYDSIHFFPPAHSFYKVRDHIYTTPLFALLKSMPKGGIQHLHPAAGGSYWWVVNRAVKEPDCYVFWQNDKEPFVKGQLRFFPQGAVPPGFYPVQKLADSISGFTRQLYDLLTFDQSIANDSVDIWKEFEQRFQRVGGFISYQPVFEDYYTAMFDTLAADGVQHVELRMHLGGNLYTTKHTGAAYAYDSMIQYLRNAVRRIRAAKEPGFTVKLIYASTRFRSLEEIKQDIEKAFAVRSRYPDLVVAYDLVGQEDKGHTTLFYRDAWLLRDSLSRVYGVDLPLCLHDGESTWQHVTNLYDAVLLNSTRIGHGFNLSFFPSVEDRVRQQNTCIEVSPLSNQILGYITDLRMHPAHAWIRRGIQISLNPDDPAIFGYTGVTPDYWSVALAWELDLRALKKLAFNALEYSYLKGAEKAQALTSWQQKWEVFIRQHSSQP